jgi:CRISPR-associated protein Csx3
LAVYGRGVAWIIAALARLAYPAPFLNFDTRLGWVQARPLQLQDAPAAYPLRFILDRSQTAFTVTVVAPDHYVDYDEIGEAAAPQAPARAGVILSGKLPLWLFASLAITYHSAPWLAVYQPPLGGSVVVHSVDGRWPPGRLLSD